MPLTLELFIMMKNKETDIRVHEICLISLSLPCCCFLYKII